MGGEDGWLGAQFDNQINVSAETQNYVFQSIAVPLRGFDENIRNGNNFVLWNSEVRFPVFHYLLNRPIKSDFFNTFQIISFSCRNGLEWINSIFKRELVERNCSKCSR